jgi:hypothetical protein
MRGNRVPTELPRLGRGLKRKTTHLLGNGSICDAPPSGVWSGATCKYTLVTSTLACPAASRTSGRVRPPASACEMNECRP